MKFFTSNKTVKGFTIAEVLVTLVITSIAITLSYSTFNYIHKLFFTYKLQSRFISEYTVLNERLGYEALNSEMITEQAENKWLFQRDSIANTLEITENAVLMKNHMRCDTFHLKCHDVRKFYEPMLNVRWQNRLLQSLSFETEFSKQKFIFYFHKKYDGSVKMKLERSM